MYVPLLLPVVAAGSARHVADRVDPRLATWLLTVSATLLAGASGVVLVAVAVTALGQVGVVAGFGDWSVRGLRRHDPTSLATAVLACVLLAAVLVALARVVGRRVVALARAARTAHRLPGGALTVVDDPVPDAFALPGRPGRIVVSTGMLRALDPAERRVLLAHERAHLRYAHHAFVTLAQIASAANPLLRPTATAVAYAVERWADEHAARSVGDRLLTARTIGKAALLAGRHPCRPAVRGEPAGRGRLGPVPRRIAALAAPPRLSVVLLAATFAVLATVMTTVSMATAAAAATARDVHTAFEVAELPIVGPVRS